MAHNIDNMAYVGEVPWHGLGVKVNSVMTAEEAIKAGRLDWRVNKKDVFLQDGQKIEGKFATVREDNIPLGIVGPNYTVLNNSDAFSFMDALITEKTAVYHTVGSLGKGERVWVLAKLPESVEVTHKDVVDQFLLLSNSHDGSSSVTVRFTPIRVVCQNTLMAAFNHSSYVVNIRHTTNMGDKVEEARRIMGISSKFYSQFSELAKAMTHVKSSAEIVEEMLKSIGYGKQQIEERDSTRSENIRSDILKFVKSGKGSNLEGTEGTLWGMLNGIVEYVDYGRKSREIGNGAESNRLETIWFGAGADLKKKAWDCATELVKVRA